MELLTNILLALSDYMITVLSFVAAVLVVHCFYDDAVTLERRDMITSLITVMFFEICSAVNTYVLKVKGYTNVLTFISLLPLTIPIISAAIRTKTKRFRRFLRLIVTMCAVSIVCYTIGNILLYLINLSSIVSSEYIQDKNNTGAMQATTIIIILTVIVVYYLFSRYVRIGLTMPFRIQDKIFTALYVIACVLIMQVYNVLNSKGIDLSQGHDTIRVFFVVTTAIITLALPILILRNRQTKYFNELSREHEKFLEAELAASQQYREAQEETKAFRHDVKNNLGVVTALMNDGKYEEAAQFIRDMYSQVSALSPKVVTGDEMLDALISTKLAKITEDGIDFTIDGVADGGFDWKPIDVCTVFANALDNAIEACELLEDEDARFIRLEFRKTRHQRLIILSNSTSQEVDCEKLLSGTVNMTTKKKRSLHGYGVRNIRRTLEKYGGMMELSCEDGIFTMNMILNLESPASAAR